MGDRRDEMQKRKGCGLSAWVSPWLSYSKHSELRNARISQERGHDLAFSSVNIVLQDFEVWGHRGTDGLRGRAVIMLATLGRDWDSADDIEEAEKVGKYLGVGEDVALGGWRGAGVIPSISPTSSRAAIELCSMHSPAAGAVKLLLAADVACLNE
jgi:hypothetical protein